VQKFATLLAAALLATPAAAESLKDPPSRATPRAAAAAPAPAAEFNWTGFYIGLDAGYQVGDNRLKGSDPGRKGVPGQAFVPGQPAIPAQPAVLGPEGEVIIPAVPAVLAVPEVPFIADIPAIPASGFDLDGLSTEGVVYGGRVGGDVQFKGTPFVIGLFGTYNQGKAKFDLDAWSGSTTTNVHHATIEPKWGVGGRAGVVVYNGALLYGGWMYRWADLNLSADGPRTMTVEPASAVDVLSAKRNLKGQSLLAGLEVPVTKMITVGLEYQYTWHDSVNLLPTDARQRLDLDAENHAFMARVTLRAPVTSLPGFAVASPGN